MARILVTGGPVHTKLDAVKIITNRFKGGRMAALANALSFGEHAVTYLTSRHTIPPGKLRHCAIGTHDGFVDYMDKVRLLAVECDMLVLGAAVANLVPEPPWDVNEKFPSHDYEEGDLVNVPFRVAPRIINMVKEANPRCTLVGFKLLSNVSDEVLVRAAYTVITDSKADLVVANDTANLDRKLLVTRERSVIETDSEGLVGTINSMAHDEHYMTVNVDRDDDPRVQAALDKYFRVMSEHGEEIEKHGTVNDMVFGCVAVEVDGGGFLCSPRGKNTIHEDPVLVTSVDHPARVVHVATTPNLENETRLRASLNAPLLDRIFESDPRTWGIVHTHQTDTGLSTLPYAFPGTVRDSQRDLLTEDFEIDHHGTFTHLLETP